MTSLHCLTKTGTQFALLASGNRGFLAPNARGDRSRDGDVDVLVDLERHTFDSYMDLLLFLEGLFGSKVDLVMKETIKPRIKNRILSETVYVEGL